MMLVLTWLSPLPSIAIPAVTHTREHSTPFPYNFFNIKFINLFYGKLFKNKIELYASSRIGNIRAWSLRRNDARLL